MNDDQLLRYSRQIMLPEIEIEGQERLLASRVLIVGMGGLGCPIALYLAAAGVGDITLIDDDLVDLTNLQRQIAHQQSDIGRPKVESARESMLALNDTINIRTIPARLDRKLLQDMAPGLDLVVDATDNFEVRFTINEVCVSAGLPVIFGAAVRLEGQILVFDPESDGGCYQCLYGTATDGALNCSETGVAAPVVGIVGTMQAMEALRMLAQIGTSSGGYLQVLDAKYMEWRKLKLPKNPNCPTCGIAKVD